MTVQLYILNKHKEIRKVEVYGKKESSKKNSHNKFPRGGGGGGGHSHHQRDSCFWSAPRN